jgi:predicted nucleic acid-binding protein
MSTDVMKGRITETSPQVYARIGGVLYLIIIVIGFCREFFVRDKLVVSGDVTAKGVAVTTIDALIAAIALEHGATLFTLDKDFSRLASITRLPLYVF